MALSGGFPNSAWDCEAGEKQVAMIAQKVVDANQPKEERGRFVAFSDT